MASQCPPRGVYAPVVAFFHEDESLDLEALETHITRLAKAGVAGLVIQGSNGEAPHLLHSERKQVIGVAAKILKKHGKPGAVIIAGCGAQSTRETIQLCNEAAEAGASYSLVLSPSYWGKLINMTPDPRLLLRPTVKSSTTKLCSSWSYAKASHNEVFQ